VGCRVIDLTFGEARNGQAGSATTIPTPDSTHRLNDA